VRPPAPGDPAIILPEKDHAPDASAQSGAGPVRAYEEALPDNIVEAAIPPLVPIEPVIPPSPVPIAEDRDRMLSALELATSHAPPKTPEDIITPPQQQASLPKDGIGPEPLPEQANVPVVPISTWQINALPFEMDDRPKIAIVIDDMGIDRKRSRRAVALTAPLTLSYLTYGRDLEKQTTDAKAAGHELMMHIPMEPTSTTIDPGPNVLLRGMDSIELLQNLRWDLDQFDGYVGINNHMGSRFTESLPGMQSVMSELKKRGLLFLDSVTSPKTKGSKAARSAGVPHLVRNIFLDHVEDLKVINMRLAETERLARKQGYVIAIGHPRELTLTALEPWLKTIEQKGFQLVPLTALFKLKPVQAENTN
jgi:polysaccharide deacetylase 2 family uncharacterized protein YibQ